MKKDFKAFLAATLCAGMATAVGFGVSGMQANVVNADGVGDLTIQGQTLTLSSNLHVNLLVKAAGLNVENVRVRVTEGDEVTVLQGVVQDYANKNGEMESFIKFSYAGITATEMTNVVYAQAYMVDGSATGAEFKYSVLDYAFNKLGLAEREKNTDDKFTGMLEALLAYGAASEYYAEETATLLNYTTDYAYLAMDNATFSDGYATGIYKKGELVTITPNAGYIVKEGAQGFTNNGDGSYSYVVTESKPDFSKTIVDHRSQSDSRRLLLLSVDFLGDLLPHYVETEKRDI